MEKGGGTWQHVPPPRYATGLRGFTCQLNKYAKNNRMKQPHDQKSSD